jgi:hypothetical protein
MMIGFSAKNEIINLQFLYGRKSVFSQLLNLANRRQTVSLIGLRRFGKTSILKCLENELRADEKSKVYPIFFDFKEVGSIIKGTNNVYRYMISRLVERLFIDKHFTKEEIFKKKTIFPTNDWVDIYDNLSDVNPVRIQSLFEEIISFFSEYLERTILFIFDEYEYLFKYSFDDPVGFMKMRNFASRINDIGINSFSFFISGTLTWEHLCTITGSGEMNCIDESIYITPIDYNSFQEMWKGETELIESCPSEICKNCEFAFQSSGGVPFYGKLIGSSWLNTTIKPNYFILKSYFQEIFNTLQNEEKDILIELSKLPRDFKNSKYVLELVEKGLIKRIGSHYEITINFLRDYIKADILDLLPKPHEIPLSLSLTDTICKTIITINNTYKTKRGCFIFEPVNDDAALIKDLRTPCYSQELFSDFASSLYKIVFEKTKETRNGIDTVKAKLPSDFKKKNQFIEIVDIMRHSLGGGHLMDTFSYRNGQLTKPQMLELLVGTKNDPNTPDEFYKLQIATLKLFQSELNRLNAIVRKI